MKKTLKIENLLYLLLLSLPVIDNIYKFREDANSPAVIVRAIVIAIMVYLLFRTRPLGQSSKRIIGVVVFFIIYIVVISFVFTQEMWVFYSLIRISYSFLGFILFYFLAKKSAIDEKSFGTFFILLIVIIAINSYMNIGQRMDTARGLGEADNTGSALMCTYAGVMLLTKRKAFPFAIFLVLVGTVISGKRGAIIGVALASLPLLKYIFTGYSRSMIKKMFFVLLAVIGVTIAMRYFGDFFDAALGRFEKLEDDGGSGRDMIYSAYWNHFLDSNPLLKLFGHGLRSAAFGSGSIYAFEAHAAHNDWLQILFDFGIIGVLTYATVFIKMIGIAWNRRKHKDMYHCMLLMSIVLWLVKSATSSTFMMTTNSIYLFMTAAYAIAKLEQGNPKYKIVKIIKSNDHQTTS